MKAFKYVIVMTMIGFFACEEEGVEKVPFTRATGEFVAEFELTQPFETQESHHFKIYNTSGSNDSLWIDEPDFFDSKVKVARTGNKFSIEGGTDIIHGEIVNITGEVFPAKDSVHVEWRYLQGGDPADDYVVIANGHRYTGLDDDL